MPKGEKAFDILIDILKDRTARRYSEEGKITIEGTEFIDLLDKIRIYISERLPAQARIQAFYVSLGIAILTLYWAGKYNYAKLQDIEDFYRWILRQSKFI